MNNICRSKSSNFDMLIKIDLEKAFDRLEWSFVYRALRFFKFPPKMSRFIMYCISTSSIGILVNGSRMNFFSPSRGIHQGDHISSYVFILCLELLSRLINHQVNTLRCDPIKTKHEGPSFSHVLFADDFTLMEKANKKTGQCIKSCMDFFVMNSGSP